MNCDQVFEDEEINELDLNCSDRFYFNQFIIDESSIPFASDGVGEPSGQNDKTDPKTPKRRRDSPATKPKSRKKPRKVKKSEEKQYLAELMKGEELIWNKQHALHSNSNALNAAWKRIADQMPSSSVAECKAMWRSMRDALRYQRKSSVKGKSGDSADEEHTEDGDNGGEDVDITNMLSFLTPVTTQFPRKTIALGATDDDDENPSNDDTINEEASTSTSNYSYAVRTVKKDDVAESVMNISNAISQLVAVASAQPQPVHAPASEFKYDYIWKHVETLYQQLDEASVNQMNQTIVNMVYDKIKDAKENE